MTEIRTDRTLQKALFEREGKPWTRQEGDYAMGLVEAFNKGTLESLAEGTTLRDFLRAQLNCSAQRVCQMFGMTAEEECVPMNALYVKKSGLSLDEAFVKGRKLKKLRHSYEFALSVEELLPGSDQQVPTQGEPLSRTMIPTSSSSGEDRLMELYHQQLLLERQVRDAIGGPRGGISSFGLGSAGIAPGQSLYGHGMDGAPPSKELPIEEVAETAQFPSAKRHGNKGLSASSVSREGPGTSTPESLRFLPCRRTDSSSLQMSSGSATTNTFKPHQGNTKCSTGSAADLAAKFSAAVAAAAPVPVVVPDVTRSQQHHDHRNTLISALIAPANLQAATAYPTKYDADGGDDDDSNTKPNIPAEQPPNNDNDLFHDEDIFLQERKRVRASPSSAFRAVSPQPELTTTSSSSIILESPTTVSNSKKRKIG